MVAASGSLNRTVADEGVNSTDASFGSNAINYDAELERKLAANLDNNVPRKEKTRTFAQRELVECEM